MSKVLRTAAIVVGVAAIVVATGGAAAVGIGTAATAATAATATAAATAATAATVAGISGATLALVAGGLSIAASFFMKRPQEMGTSTDFKADVDAGIPYIIGRTFAGGNIVHQDSFGDKRKYQSFVTVYSGAGPVQEFEAFKVDRVTTTFDGTTNAVGYYHDMMWLKTQLGATPEAAALTSAMGSVPGWGGASKLSGYCASLWTLKYDVKGDRNYNNGVPKPGAVIKGVKVYDPRLDGTYPGGSGSCRALDESTYVYSENPWLHALTFALGRFQNGKRVMGIGMALAGINVPAYVEAANIADANNWKAGGQIYSTEDKWDRLKAMAQAGGGAPMRLSAQLSCMVNAPRVALATITSADIMGEATNVTTQRRRDRINGVIPRYRSEGHDWEVVPAAVVRVPGYVTADGGERTREISFPLVQDVDQAAKLAAYEIVNSREMGPISIPLSTKWYGYKPGDCLTVDVPELGLLGQACIIINRSLDPSTGTVTLELKTETVGKHTFALSQAGTAPPVPDTTRPADADEIAFFNRNSSVSVEVTPSIAFAADYQGVVTPEFLPTLMSPRVSLNGQSVKTDDLTTYSLVTSGVTATVNNTPGSAAKGDVTITELTANTGYIDLIVSYSGTPYAAKRTVITKNIGLAPSLGGAGAKIASDNSFNSTASTSYVAISDVVTVTLATGESLRGTAPLDYVPVAGGGQVTRTASLKWQYSTAGAGAWSDFGGEATGSGARSADAGEPEYGHVDCIQSVGALAVGDYDVRLMARINAPGRNVSFTGTATVEAKV